MRMKYGSNFEAEKAEIIAQYRTVTSKFDELWQEINLRTDGAAWKRDGVGSCKAGPGRINTWLEGVVDEELETLWDDANASTGGDKTPHACQFHRQDHGCVLGDLKSPRCVAHVDMGHGSEIRDKLGIELPDFRTPLQAIQLGAMETTSQGPVLHPELNAELVERTVHETEVIIGIVRSHPLNPGL